MDSGRFIDIVKGFPEVWDRNNSSFREQNLKNQAWERIGQIMNTTANICKDTFKSLREKYVREREKQNLYGEKYTPWCYLNSLLFLDPHIILRKQSINENENFRYEEKPSLYETKNSVQLQHPENHNDFDRNLIALVKKASPIWDRKNNGYPSKQVKHQLWKSIAQTMKKDVNVCMTRWKGLREKYIRQKMKFQEGESKWEFLEDMAFLDQVIQYRRRNYDPDYIYNAPSQNGNSKFQNSNDFYDDNSIHDSSSNDFLAVVKNEDLSYDNVHEGSYDSGLPGRKRSISDDTSEASYGKKERVEERPEKTPEVMFGELIAAMLAKKPERERNIAMIEIMKVLTK